MGQAHWLRTLRRYLLVNAGGHLAWEFAQMPLYTLWTTGTIRDIVLSGLHCTGGDLLIAMASLLAALMVAGGPEWPVTRFSVVAVLTVLTGFLYTAFSEWLNVSVRGAWAYAPSMPVVSVGPARLGVSPLLQWIVVPALALGAARPAR
jgi:hypothetical protein